jgi:transposase
MKIEAIDIQTTIENAKAIIREDKQLSASTRSIVEILIVVITLLANRLNLDSTNSSKPPSGDPNRKKRTRAKSDKKAGGQKGHVGTTLKKIDNPDKIKKIKVDQRKLPRADYHHVGFEKRQVFDIDISRIVTEYQAEIVEDEKGNRFVAPFPSGVTKAAQYGNGIKAHAVYMSQFQLLPYNRIQDYFADQLQIPISEGSIFNFNKEAFGLLAEYEILAKNELAQSQMAHADETGINIGGKRHWLHGLSNDQWTYYHPHEKRGTDAMDDIGILPRFKGMLCHDHWKPYFQYDCTHCLCNAHHLRELQRAWEQDGQNWAKEMQNLLEKINRKVTDAGGALKPEKSKYYQKKYRELLVKAEIECPEPIKPKEKGKRGRIKRSKSRNLLERLKSFENEVLRFMDFCHVPFTNNLGENDIRMTKVQQKISGCFRSMEGAMIFCRVRGYLSTCRKQEISSTQALCLLFNGKLPNFTLTE